MNAPRLAGLSIEYLKRQMNNFNRGIRGVHPEDKPGKQMAVMVRTLRNESEVYDVLVHINKLKVPNN